MAEKSEKATPKKLRDARKKGQVAKSQDLPSAFTFVISIAVVLGMSVTLYHYLGDFLVTAFKHVNEKNLDVSIIGFFAESIKIIFLASMPVMVIVAALGVMVNFLMVGQCFLLKSLNSTSKNLTLLKT